MKRSLNMLTAFLLVVILSGCGGPSSEKVGEVQETYSQLVSRHNEAVEVYSEIEDDSFSKELDNMAESIDEIGQQDVKEMTNDEIDAMIEKLQTNITEYDTMLASMEEAKNNQKEEETKTNSVSVTLKNNSGVELYEIYLYQASKEEKGENYAAGIGKLEEYETLNILNLPMTEEDTLFHLEAQDEDGNVIETADIDFSEWIGKSVTVRMDYSFDTMEGWIEFED